MMWYRPMRITTAGAASLMLVGAVSAAAARADLVAFDFSTSAFNVGGLTTDQDFGIEFTPTSNLLVTTLLVWDSDGDDFATFDADVAVWDVANPSTPIVAGAITTAGSPTQPSASSSLGIWRVADVPDTLLLSGVTYRLAADGFSFPDKGRGLSITPVLNGITLSSPNPGVESSPMSSWVAGPEYPNLAGLDIWVTASFTYSAIPEPRAFWLVGLVAAGSLVTYLFRGCRHIRANG